MPRENVSSDSRSGKVQTSLPSIEAGEAHTERRYNIQWTTHVLFTCHEVCAVWPVPYSYIMTYFLIYTFRFFKNDQSNMQIRTVWPENCLDRCFVCISKIFWHKQYKYLNFLCKQKNAHTDQRLYLCLTWHSNKELTCVIMHNILQNDHCKHYRGKINCKSTFYMILFCFIIA